MQARLMLRLLAALIMVAAPIVAGAETTYGAGVILKDTTPFSRILESPSMLEGQTVRVEGMITSVCTRMGCWMGLVGVGGSDYANPVFVRVDPGKIVFPVSAVGHRASVQGVIQSVGSDPDPEAQEAAAEYGKENSGGTPALWELKATGAVIQ